MRYDGYRYYCAKMEFSDGFNRYMDFDALDKALEYIASHHEFKIPLNGEILVLENAVIWKMKPEKVYEFKRKEK